MLHSLVRLAYMEVAAGLGFLLLYVLVKQGILRTSLHSFLAAVVVTCAILSLSFNIWVSFALLVCMALALCRNREHIAGILLLIILITPNIRLFLYIGSIRLVDIGLTDVVSLTTLVVLLAKGGRAKVSPWADLCALAWLIMFVLFSARDTSVTNYARVFTQTILDNYIPYWVVTRSLRTLRDLRVFMLYLIATGCVLSGFLLFESFTGWPVFREITAQYGMDPQWHFIKWRNGLLRASGPFLEPTSMAFGLVFLALAAWQFRSVFARPAYRYAVIAFLCFGMALCQSRNAYLGLGVGLVAIEAFRRLATTNGRWMLPLLAFGLVVPPITYFVVDQSDAAAATETDATVLYRYKLMVRGMEEIRKSPIIGTSKDVATHNLEDLRQGEHIIDFVNTYIYVALLSGIIGLVIFIAIICYGLFAPLSVMRHAKEHGDVARREGAGYVFAMSTVILLMLFFTFCGGRISVMVWMIVGLAGCIGRLAGDDVKSMPRRRPATLPALPALA